MSQYPSPYPPNGYPVPPNNYPTPPMQGGYPPNNYPAPPMQGNYPPNVYPTPPVQGNYPAPPMPGGYPPQQIQTGSPALSLPPEIAQQAASYQLGALTQHYHANFFKLLAIVIITLLATLFDIPVMLADKSAIFVFLVLLAANVLTIWYFLANFNVKAYVFTEGLIHTQGSKIEAMRWEHVEAVWEKIVKYRYRGLIPIYTTYNYTVKRSDGAQFKFRSGLKNTKQLGEAIQQEVTRRQLPRAIAAYDSGQPANFGSLSISMQGISKNGVVVPWNQVGQVKLRRGWVIVPRQGSLLAASRTRCSTVPNLRVFLQLFEHARQRAGAAMYPQYFPSR